MQPARSERKARERHERSSACIRVLRTAASPARVGRYDSDDPHAVHATFHTGENETVEWVFARDLLGEGLREPTGYGDVRVWPSRSRGAEVVCISLSSPEGHALLEAPADDLRVFLNRTYVTVPPGTEHLHIDLDSELVALLEGELPG
jgi:hypothetical protein